MYHSNELVTITYGVLQLKDLLETFCIKYAPKPNHGQVYSIIHMYSIKEIYN